MIEISNTHRRKKIKQKIYTILYKYCNKDNIDNATNELTELVDSMFLDKNDYINDLENSLTKKINKIAKLKKVLNCK